MASQMSFQRILLAVVFGGVMLTTGIALAQDPEPEYVPESVEVTEEFNTGWDYTMRVGLGTTFANSQAVIGNADGTSWTLGFNLEGGLLYMRDFHEVRTTLNMGETFTRTPLVDEFVKSGDLIELEGIYLYHIPSAPWFGPFYRLRLATSAFPGTDVRPGVSTYAITRPDGTVDYIISERLDTTDALLPFFIKTALGAFIRPVTPADLQFELLVGMGLRQTFADNQLAVSDDPDTDQIEITELETLTQAGAEAVATAWGELAEGRVAYNAGIEIMIPFLNDLPAGDDRGAFDLTNIDIFAGVSFRIVEWASLEYQLRAIQEPQLLDEFQIQNNLLFSVGYTLLDTTAEEVVE